MTNVLQQTLGAAVRRHHNTCIATLTGTVAASLLVASAANAQAAWRVSGAAVPAVSSALDDIQFKLPHPCQLSTGAIVVLDAGSREIWWLPRSATEATRIGRPGSGPSEIQRGNAKLDVIHDSILILEPPPGPRRLLRFDSAGRFRKSDNMMLAPGAPRGGITTLSMVTSDHALGILGGLRGIDIAVGRVTYDTISIGLLTVSTGVVDQLAQLRGTPRLGYSVMENGRTLMPSAVPPLLPRSLFVAGVGKVAFGESDADSITIVDVPSRRRSAVRLPWKADPIVAGSVATARQRMLADALNASDSAKVTAIFQRAVIPTTAPRYLSLQFGWQGELWVERFRYPHDRTAQFSVLDQRGRWIANVTMPTGFRLEQAGADFVLGVLVTGDGEELVRKFALQRN